MGRVRIRLSDVAKKTGYSANTVSLALRDSPRIPERTRALIRKAADELGYLPNRIAQSLVSRRSMTVGLVLTDIRNPILTEVAQAIETALAGHGYAVMFATSADKPGHEVEVVATLRERQVDGLLVYPVNHAELAHLAQLHRQGVPVVCLVPDPSGQLDSVGADDSGAALAAVRHLAAQGRRRIVLLDAGNPGITAKRDGFLQGLAEIGQAGGAECCAACDKGIEGGIAAMQALRDRGLRPDAVLASNDRVAFGVEIWCRDVGLSVPEDVALVGFDDIEMARVAPVPISTLAYPVASVAQAAVARLLAQMGAPEVLPIQAVTFDRNLIIRASSGG